MLLTSSLSQKDHKVFKIIHFSGLCNIEQSDNIFTHSVYAIGK